jgi:hypothetical protein
MRRRRKRSCIGWLLALAACWGSAARADPPAADSGEPPELETSETLELSKLEPEQIRELLARYAQEPSAQQVVEAALRAADGDPERFASMLSRARWRGLLPNILLGARRGQGVDLRTTLADVDGDRFTSGDDLVLSATLRFELGRLLFADEEVSITREARAARSARLELARSVIHWYFVRRRLQLERDALQRSSIARELRIAEIEALLDAFTNGAFGRMIARLRSAWTTEENTRVFPPP